VTDCVPSKHLPTVELELQPVQRSEHEAPEHEQLLLLVHDPEGHWAMQLQAILIAMLPGVATDEKNPSPGVARE